MPRTKYRPTTRPRVSGTAKPIKNRPKTRLGTVQPLPKAKLRPSKDQRNWKAYEARLVRRGQVAWLFEDPELLHREVPTAAGGRPRYSQALLLVALVLRAMDDLDWRTVEGRLRDLLRLAGFDGPSPDHPTLLRRGADPKVLEALQAFLGVHSGRKARRKGSVVVLVDSTGLTLAGPGGYVRDKHRASRRGKYHLLHLATDARTGETLAFELTPATRCRNLKEHEDGLACTCPRIGDGPVAEQLLKRLTKAGIEVEALVGDGAYSGTPLRTVAAMTGTRVVAPLPSRAAYQSPTSAGALARNQQLMHERHLGTIEWKRRSRYHVRSSVEADIGGYKAVMGEVIRSKGFAQAQVEVGTKLLLRNHWMFH